jgi:endonuclease III
MFAVKKGKRNMIIQPLRDDLMVQQQLPDGLNFTHGAWQHMVAVIMLNQTGRKPVKTVAPIFWSRWRGPRAFYNAAEQEVKDVIRPLGMVNVRYQRLKKMTWDFGHWDGKNAQDLYGIGKYGSDSYEIFFKQNYTVEPTDKELIRYLQEEVMHTC